MKKFSAFLLLLAASLLPARAQLQSPPLTVEAGKTAFITRLGVTAAYSLDGDTVQAEAAPGGFRITGKAPGAATIVVVTTAGARTLNVSVLAPPQPKRYGAATTGVSGQTVEFGQSEYRYNNDPSQMTTYQTMTQVAGDRQIHIEVMNTDSTPQQGQAPVEFPLVSYEIAHTGRSLTLIDRMVSNTDLTLNQVLLRGVHFVHGPWQFHSGITSMTEYQGFLLPTQRVTIAGLSRQFKLNSHSALEGNLYYFKAGSDAAGEATSGPLATAYYQYSRGEHLAATAELGVGRGVALASKVALDSGNQTLHASFHYQSPNIASLYISQVHGRSTNIGWSDKFNKHLIGSLSADDTAINLSTSSEVADTGTFDPTWWVNPHFGILAGLTASRFLAIHPSSPGIRSAGVLAGPQFSWRRFGGAFQLQELKNSGNVPDSTNYNVTLQTTSSHVNASVFYNAQTQTPVFAPIQSGSQPDLQPLLLHQSQMAQNPQQITQFLQQTAALSSQGYVGPIAIVLAALRRQYGINIDASGNKLGHLTFQGFVNGSTGGNTPAVRLVMGNLLWTRKVGLSNVLNAGVSLFKTDTGNQSQLQPVLQFSWQHQLNTVPRWLVPGRRGIIAGHVFVDAGYVQVYKPGDPPLAGVVVYLDGRRTVRTDSNGYYVFHGVPWGTHAIQVSYHDSRAFYYTGSSPRDVPVGSTADFGISFAQGRIFGKFVSDTGEGLPISLTVQGHGIVRQVNADGDGNVEIDGLPDGNYTIDPDSLSAPAGYSLSSLVPQSVPVTAARAGHFQFTLPAQRSIAGRIAIYDPITGKTTPLGNVTVSLGSGHASMQTDSDGRYLFRQLPSGSYTLTVAHDGKLWTRAVFLGHTPDIETSVDITITQPSTPSPEPSLPVEPPATPPSRLRTEPRRPRLQSRRNQSPPPAEPATAGAERP